MSRATMAVLFPDGEVRWGVYEGTSDVYAPWLYGSSDEAWDGSRTGRRTWDEPAEGTVFNVEIYSDYGYGWVVLGTASKNRIVTPTSYDDAPSEYWEGKSHDDYPDWLKPFFGGPA